MLLKNKSDKVKSILKNVTENESLKFEVAKYSYVELCKMMEIIMDYKKKHENEDYAKDIISCELNDKENNIDVKIKNITDEKIKFFKENILDDESLIFKNCTKEMVYCSEATNKNDIKTTNATLLLKAGMPLYVNGIGAISLGFPVYRDINSGRQYGFVTCVHSIKLDDNIVYYDSRDYPIVVGEVKLLRLGGKYDVSFVSVNSNASCSPAINKTLYSLIRSNDEIDYPVAGKKVFMNSKYHNDTTSTILSTNWCGTAGDKNGNNYAYYENCLRLSGPSKPGDSGGLISSQGPTLNTRVQEGIIIASDGSTDTIACSAYNIVNLWYLTCY